MNRRKNNIKYNKRNKVIKKYKKYLNSNYHIESIFKIILIFIIILINYIFASILNNTNKIQMNNNNWIKKNMTKYINNYLSPFKNNYDYPVLREIRRLKRYFSLKVIVKGGNSTLNLETKEKLIERLKTFTRKNFSLVKNIFIESSFNFGNVIVAFNNLIYYSEILGIKNIYLNSKINWYIKNDINTDKIHISLISKNSINCTSYDTFCGNIMTFYYQQIVKSERRSLLLKDEIKRNLPSVLVNKNDLYIYIRAGDSFVINGTSYPQAPYCFYQKIISEFKFDDIYLISQDDRSPIIQKLLKDYPKIKHNLNKKEIDIATLMNAYNLVNAFSTFSLAAITFNDNLINLFEYESGNLGKKIIEFHYDIDKLDRKFNIYRMKASEDYFIKIFHWRNTEEQQNLLFEEKCKYNFKKTKYTKTIFD